MGKPGEWRHGWQSWSSSVPDSHFQEGGHVARSDSCSPRLTCGLTLGSTPAQLWRTVPRPQSTPYRRTCPGSSCLRGCSCHCKSRKRGEGCHALLGTRGSCDLATSFSRQGSKPAASRMPVDAGHRGGVFRDALREQHKLRGPFMLHREVLNGKSWTYRRSLSGPHKRHCHETQKQQQQVSRRERCAQPLTQFLEVPRGNPFACSSALQTPTCLDPIEEALDRVVQQTCTPFGSHFHWNPMTDLHSSDRQALADSLGPRQTLAPTQCPHGRHLACGDHLVLLCGGLPEFFTTPPSLQIFCPGAPRLFLTPLTSADPHLAWNTVSSWLGTVGCQLSPPTQHRQATAAPLSSTVLGDRACDVVDTTRNLHFELVHAVLTLVASAYYLRFGVEVASLSVLTGTWPHC